LNITGNNLHPPKQTKKSVKNVSRDRPRFTNPNWKLANIDMSLIPDPFAKITDRMRHPQTTKA
jgi:hypothetical protein